VKYQLVLQWSGSSQEDHDAVVTMTDDLEHALGDAADVDGWDFGSGEMNIFIYTDEPQAALGPAKAVLEAHGRVSGLRAAYRDVEGDDFTVLWPETLASFEDA
jgi:hypothetical protein